MSKRSILSIIAILVAISLVSSTTAAVHVQSKFGMKAMKKIKKKDTQGWIEKESLTILVQKLLDSKSFENFVKILPKSLKQKITGKIVDVNIKKLREIILQYTLIIKAIPDLHLNLNVLGGRNSESNVTETVEKIKQIATEGLSIQSQIKSKLSDLASSLKTSIFDDFWWYLFMLILGIICGIILIGPIPTFIIVAIGFLIGYIIFWWITHS
ncbi:MAG: hypothetical protein DRN16_01295 [Thermoplasmata archaeon]|nr:MAG: hypothetical protein DRN16_01295 [Thermoplasmata archaeon]